MKTETGEALVVVGGVGVILLGMGALIYFGVKDKRKFAKYVMEHPDEYKIYQDVEKFKALESKAKSLESDVHTLKISNQDLLTKNASLTEKLKGYVKQEYADLFDLDPARE